jgi:hypothetical protein
VWRAILKSINAKDKNKPYGTFVDIQEKDWRWYKLWLEEVLKYCRKNAARFATLHPVAPINPAPASGDAPPGRS